VLDAFVAVQASRAPVLVVLPEGADTSVTVGGWTAGGGAETTVQLALALAEPLELLTVTVKVCAPMLSPV
jgi:hypothetical protein